MKDNNGITLVELIISIAISSLVTLSLVFIISYTMGSYKKANEEAVLQTEFQTVTNQLEKLIIEAYNVKFDDTNKVLKIYQDNDTNSRYEVNLVADELHFRQFNPGGLVGWGLFGRYITNFHVEDTGADNKNNKIKISISFKKGSSNEITLDKTIVLRNSIKATP